MNRKLSSFESINAKDINKDLTYVSAVQKLSDGSYKNINIPLAQLSGLWNDDVKTAVANADFEGGAIDAEVIHQAALNAVENAIASAEAAIEEATNKANQLVNDYNTGNTQTQILIREAQERLDQQITSAIDKVSQIQTMYDQYFGAGGIVEQKASEANRALNQAQDALNDAQDLLDRLNNGEIVPTGIEDLSRKIDNLETLWGQKGTWISEEDATNRIMTQFENYIDLLTASKNFTMTYANGSTGEVKKFTDFLNLMKGEYEKVLSKVDTVNQQYLEMGERWDEASETMKQFVTKTDLSDEINPVVDSAVRKTSSKLIEDAVYSATMQVVGELLFEQSTEVGTKKLVKIKDSQLYYNFLPDTSYYLRWDGNTDDDAVNIYYQFIIVDSNASFNSSNWTSNTNYSEDNWNLLTNDAIRSIGEPTTTVDPNSQQTVEVPDTRTRYLALKYTGYSESGSKTLSKQCKVTAQIEKYMSAAQLQISAKEAVLSAFENDPGVRQRLSELKVGQGEISQAVNNYFSANEFDAAGIKNTADQVSTYVLEYLKNSDGTYKTLESEISSTKEAIEQTVIDASLTSKAVWNKTKVSEYNLTTNYSIDQSGAKANLSNLVKHYELETGHEYILKGRDLDVLFYTLNSNNVNFNNNSTVFDQNSTYEWSDNPFGNWVKAENPNSIKIVIPNVGGNSNSKILSFYIKVKKVKGNSNNLVYLDNPEVEIFETVNSKMGNFKVSADVITETLFDTEAVDGNGENVITKIYNRLATADGVQTTVGQVTPTGFVNQHTFEDTVNGLRSSIASVGGTVQGDPFVKQSDFYQAVDEIKLNVNEVGYIALEDALCSVNYSNGSYVDGEYQSGKSYTLQDSGYQGNRYYYQNLENETGAAIILCKVKLINPNTDHLLFVNNANKYTIAKMWLFTSNGNNFNSAYGDSIMTVWYDPLSNDESVKKLRPFKSESSGISYAYIVLMLNKVQKTPVLASKTDLNGTPLNLKVGIPTDVAVSNIKQTADDIQLQVSSQEKIYNNDGSLTTKLQTAVQDITDSRITNTVAETINGKLAGYSTIEQTKDFIASTVGVGGAVTNKFYDPLFKNGYSHWHRRYGNYPDYSNITNIVNPSSNVYHKYYDNNNNYYQINSLNVLERDLKSFMIYDDNTSNINGLSAEDRRHIYGLYTNLKVTSGNKYTASFYIKLPAIFGTTSVIDVPNSNNKLRYSFQNLMLNVGFVDELAKLTPNFYITLLNMKNSFEETENIEYTIVDGENVDWSSEDVYSTQGAKKAYKFNNQGNLTGDGFNNGSVDLDQFGLWVKFGQGNLLNYLNSAFRETMSSDGIDSQNVRYRWFKIWFTFTADNKHIVKNSDTSLTNIVDDRDRAFCFEPWTNIYSNKYSRIFCEFAAPMLNSGTTPLKFSSQEKSNEVYSEIAQTNKSIELKVNNAVNKLTKELSNVGIKLDGENSSINFNAKNSTFTGNVIAKQLSVQPEGMDSKIWIEIYNPNESSISAVIKQTFIDNKQNNNLVEGTPVLIAYTNGNYYITNLTKLNFAPQSSIYYGIYGKAIISKLIIYNKGNSNNTINSFSDSSQIITKFDVNEHINTNYGTIDFYKNTYEYGELLSSTYFETLKLTNINCDTYYTKYNNNGLIPSVTAGGNRINLSEPTPDIELKMLNNKEPTHMTNTGSSPKITIFTSDGLVFVEDGTTDDFYDRTPTDNFILAPIKNIYTFRVYPKIDNGKLYDFELPMYCFAQKSGDTFKIIGFNETAYKKYISDYEKINAALVSYHGITQEVSKMFGEAIENYKGALNYGTSMYVTVNNKPAINGSGVANYYNAENGRKFLFMDPNSGTSEYEKAKSAFGFIKMLINNDPNYSISK